MVVVVQEGCGLVLVAMLVAIAVALVMLLGMHMCMVPQVVGSPPFFVLAIRRRGRPDGLERQQYQQNDGDQAAHGGGLVKTGVASGGPPL